MGQRASSGVCVQACLDSSHASTVQATASAQLRTPGTQPHVHVAPLGAVAVDAVVAERVHGSARADVQHRIAAVERAVEPVVALRVRAAARVGHHHDVGRCVEGRVRVRVGERHVGRGRVDLHGHVHLLAPGAAGKEPRGDERERGEPHAASSAEAHGTMHSSIRALPRSTRANAATSATRTSSPPARRAQATVSTRGRRAAPRPRRCGRARAKDRTRSRRPPSRRRRARRPSRRRTRPRTSRAPSWRGPR